MEVADLKILLVDDDTFILKLLTKMLMNQGLKYITACDNGADALDKMNDPVTCPDLILLDLNMPNMDGISLIKAVRGMAAHKFTPILMLTTESSDDKKKEGQGAGATGWIVKPFNPDQMLATIKKVLPG